MRLKIETNACTLSFRKKTELCFFFYGRERVNLGNAQKIFSIGRYSLPNMERLLLDSFVSVCVCKSDFISPQSFQSLFLVTFDEVIVSVSV